MLTEDEKKELLKGLDEVYAKRTHNLTESSSNEEFVVINGFKIRKIRGTFDDYAKANGLINVDDIEWNK